MIPAEMILTIAGPPAPDNFQRHLLFMHYTLRLPLMESFQMANAMRDTPLDLRSAEYIADHWNEDMAG